MIRRIIAITGGIGSGKSMVCRILMAMGYEVYDCDSRAKQLMDNSPEIKSGLVGSIGSDVVIDGNIDRKRLSQIVFSDEKALAALNGIVHKAVRHDIKKWSALQKGLSFVETAILYQSGLDSMVDEVWEVTAPHDIRIRRVMERSLLSEDEVKARIKSQESFVCLNPHGNVREIINDGDIPLLPQVENLLSQATK